MRPALTDPETVAIEPLVRYEQNERVAILTLNNPARRNVISRALLFCLQEQLARIEHDSNVKCVIIRAEGPVFSAGHDLRELVDASEADRESLFVLCTQVMEAIRNLPKPVIAQVQGLATAAGCQLVATCDLVVAADDATFATPGVKIGLFCSTPADPLSRAVPPKKAMEMLLTGESISAAEAERIGLVNRVVPRGMLEETTLDLARKVAAASGYTVGLGKRIFYEQLAHEPSRAYEIAVRAIVENARAADAQEGMKAFLEKRSPKWM